MKRIKFATLALLLVLQVLFSPFSAFAEPDLSSSPPASSEDTDQVLADNDDVQTDEDDFDQDNKTSDGEVPDTSEGESAQGTEEGQGSTDDAASEGEGTTDEDTISKDDDSTDDTASKDNAEDEISLEDFQFAPLKMGILSLPADMQGDVLMSFTGLRLYSNNGQLITSATDMQNYTGPKPKKGDEIYLNYRLISQER